MAVALTLPTGSAAAAGAFTWSGSSASASWSAGGNWIGGLAPSGVVDSLAFPALPAAQCGSLPSAGETCYTGTDDLGPLTTTSLTLDPAVGYVLSAATPDDTLTLGAGGLTAVTPPGPQTVLPAIVEIPLELAAPQAWTVDGSSAGADLVLRGGLTAPPSDSLAVTLSDFAYLKLAGAIDAGPVSFAGGTQLSGNTGAVFLLGGDLNGSSGEPVSVTDAGLVVKSAETVGPLTMSGGYLGVGDGAPSTDELDVAGGVTMDSADTFGAFINGPGTTAGADYSQLVATGNVDLGGASLQLTAGWSDTGVLACPSLRGGVVDPLIVTSGGTLSGTFAGVPDGSIVPIATLCGGGLSPPAAARIDYTATSVTATIVSAPVNTAAPKITGTAQEGQTLFASTGSWSDQPTSYSYQWVRCGLATGCTAISGATNPTYTPTAGDVGYWISVRVTASNAIGSSAPASSALTPLVSPTAPVASAAPSISGAAVPGQQLVESHGSWSPAPLVYRYQWLDCNASGGSCGAIRGAASQTYTLTGADAGYTIRVEETAYDTAGGSAPATSAPTAVVQATRAVGPGGGPARAGRSTVGSARLGKARASGLAAEVPVSCIGAPAARCAVTISLSAATKGRRGSFGSARVTIPGRQKRTLAIALNGAGRRTLAKAGTLRVVVSLVQSGRTVASETIRFRQRHRRR